MTFETELKLASTIDRSKGTVIETKSSRTILLIGKPVFVNKAGFFCLFLILPLAACSILASSKNTD
jgi:hypothetical protein